MKQKVGFIIILLLWITIYKVIDMQDAAVLDVTYDRTSQLGVDYDIPNHWIEKRNSSKSVYTYQDKTKDFYLRVYQSETNQLSLEQYIFNLQQFISNGSLSSGIPSNISPVPDLTEEKVITYKILSMDGKDIGYIESNGMDKNKNNTISRIYSVKGEHCYYHFAFRCKAIELKNYQGIFEFIVNSVKVEDGKA